MSATAPHKLIPRSVLCVFLGYSAHHKGYRCLDLSSNRVIVSRHIIFDETAFPFAKHHGPSAPADLQFLDDDTTDPVLPPIGPMHKFLSTRTPPSTADVSSAPAGPTATVLGAPLPADDANDPPAPVLYIPLALRGSRTPTAPRAATRTTSPAPRAATALPNTPGEASPLYIPPALCAGAGPLPGFPPL